MFKHFLLILALTTTTAIQAQVVHPKIGEKAQSADGRISITLVGKKGNFPGCEADYRDTDIYSPKSINVHPNGRKYYVNSLEGSKTVVYDVLTNKKLKVITHRFFDKKDARLWSKPSELYQFTHYSAKDIALNTFYGKPVESTFSHGGRYLWVPYYRRSYDINAQDPSAVAVIDTRNDSIIRLMETGPLPKMIATSPDGKLIAIAHWGNNTVGIIDISSADPKQWKHKACHVVDYQLKLDFSLTQSVDRDNGSGYALRGTVFTPDNHYLLVGCMGGGGGIAVIDLQKSQYLGRITGMLGYVRHLVLKNGFLYLSINMAGYVQKIALTTLLDAIPKMKNKHVTVTGWQNCKVGAGARTIELSPTGKYIFAACNNSSSLYVVDAQTMSVLTSIPVDSYPVGLDVSKDGKHVFVTSQGKSGNGGNAVNIYQVTYHQVKKEK
jgi:YVTN family beta-propeller protein